METINLHGLNLSEAQAKLERGLKAAWEHGVRVVRVIHGQGKHSEVFPVVKSFVRQWLQTSDFAGRCVEAFFRGEDGSPYTGPNAGETVVVLKLADSVPEGRDAETDWEEEEAREARKMAKGMRADRLRAARRKKF